MPDQVLPFLASTWYDKQSAIIRFLKKSVEDYMMIGKGSSAELKSDIMRRVPLSTLENFLIIGYCEFHARCRVLMEFKLHLELAITKAQKCGGGCNNRDLQSLSLILASRANKTIMRLACRGLMVDSESRLESDCSLEKELDGPIPHIFQCGCTPNYRISAPDASIINQMEKFNLIRDLLHDIVEFRL
jgi:hypothetical protein